MPKPKTARKGARRKATRSLLEVELLEPRLLLSAVVEPSGGPIPFHEEAWEGYDNVAVADAGGAQVVINPAPAYIWRHGCGPTAAGMVLGYWDGNGYDNLVAGDASTQTTAVSQMIASTEHYNDYSLPMDDTTPTVLADKSELGGAHSPHNSLGDYMRTSWSVDGMRYGWSYYSMVDDALTGYAQARGYAGATSSSEAWGDFTWADYTAEIDAGRPMVFLVDTDADGGTDHFITAIGYDDTANTYACLNTWDSSVHWYDFAQMGVGQQWGIYGATYFNPGTTGNPSADWTFMVYVDGDNNLESAAVDDFLEMASVGSDQNINIVVQMDRISGYSTDYGNWTDARRGLVNAGDLPNTSWGQHRRGEHGRWRYAG